MRAGIHDDQRRQFFTLAILAIQLTPRLLPLLVLVVDHVAHHGVECLLRAVGPHVFDGRVEDGVLELFGEAIAEAAFVRGGHVLDGGDVRDVAA